MKKSLTVAVGACTLSGAVTAATLDYFGPPPADDIDPEDKLVHERCTGLSTYDADKNLGVKEGGLDYYSAAIRELFEETGVLLGNLDRVAEGLPAARDALNDGSDNWADFVERNALMLGLGLRTWAVSSGGGP